MHCMKLKVRKDKITIQFLRDGLIMNTVTKSSYVLCFVSK